MITAAEYLLSSRGNQELRREDRKEEDEAAAQAKRERINVLMK